MFGSVFACVSLVLQRNSFSLYDVTLVGHSGDGSVVGSHRAQRERVAQNRAAAEKKRAIYLAKREQATQPSNVAAQPSNAAALASAQLPVMTEAMRERVEVNRKEALRRQAERQRDEQGLP